VRDTRNSLRRAIFKGRQTAGVDESSADEGK
jgi:hypothetical protein